MIRIHLFARPSSRVLVVGAAMVLLAAGLAGPAAADPSPGPHDQYASLPSGHETPPSAGPAVAPQIAAAAFVRIRAESRLIPATSTTEYIIVTSFVPT